MTDKHSIVSTEVAKFDALAHEWWNTDGAFRTLHDINVPRAQFIKQIIPQLTNKKLIDVGCGGGILAESMAHLGATVTAIDLAPLSIETAKLHLFESGLHVDYLCVDIAEVANTHAHTFDIVTCMEMLEHVEDPTSIITECYKLLKPGGYAFFSTLNRNIASYLLGIVAAEYVLRLLPHGTHDYAKFITPAELRHMLSSQGFSIIALRGISYNPLTRNAKLSNNTTINYLIACKK